MRPTYTPRLVERLLQNFLDIRATLEARGQQFPDTYAGAPQKENDARHARPPMDGKARARQIEELHVATLDIEQGLERISPDDRELIVGYHIRHDYTLDELAKKRQVASKGSLQKRIYRAVENLTRAMERGENLL